MAPGRAAAKRPGVPSRAAYTALGWVAVYAIDAYFLAGGIIFGFLALRYRAQQAHPRRRRSCLS